jgi:hypothetical protein
VGVVGWPGMPVGRLVRFGSVVEPMVTLFGSVALVKPVVGLGSSVAFTDVGLGWGFHHPDSSIVLWPAVPPQWRCASLRDLRPLTRHRWPWGGFVSE